MTKTLDASPRAAQAARCDTENAMKWLSQRRPYEVFWLREIPGDARVTSDLMSRLIKDENSGITRIQRDFYMKGEWFPPRPELGSPDGFWLLAPRNARQRLYTVARFMGDSYAGFGLAGYDALSVFHWTNQCPIRTTLAIVRPEMPLNPLPNQVIFRRRSNARRLHLSVVENSIIEAARRSHMSDNSLKERLSVFKRPRFAFQRMALYVPKSMIVVRPEMLVWGVEAEQGQPAKVKEIVMAVADILKEDVVYTDIAR